MKKEKKIPESIYLNENHYEQSSDLGYKSIFLSTAKKKNGNKKENLYRLFFIYTIKENNHVCHDHDVQINSGRTSLNMPLAGLQWTFHTQG